MSYKESYCKKHKKIAAPAVLLSGVLLLCPALSACQSPSSNTTYSDSGTYFDTVISITVYDKDDYDYIADCFDMADRYEKLFSRTIETSDVSKINNADGQFVTVDPETVTLIEDGLYYCELSDGAFDLTVGALSDLWDITNNPGVIPDEADIQDALASVDYNEIQIQGDQVALTDPNAVLDLGAIAKGYIADQMKDYLVSQGVKSAMINLGGNVLTIGSKPDGSDYMIGVQYPFSDMNETICGVPVSDQTVVSSGNYERYFELDGKIYCHIMDTSTGYPVDNNLCGVTIVTDKSVDGDGLSTTCFSLGLEKGMELIESIDGTEAIFITSDDELHCTSGLEGKITETK